MELKAQDLVAFLATLPAVVAVIVWDVLMNHVTPGTLLLANNADNELYEQYNVIRYLAGGNPKYCELLQEGAVPFVEELVEEWKVLQ